MTQRILILSTSYYPHVGGAEVAIKEITDRLPDVEFDLICAKQEPRLPRIDRIGRVTVCRLGLGAPIIDKLLLPFLATIKILHLEHSRKYDAYWGLMVTFATGAAYMANILKRLVRLPETPIILTLQEGDSEGHLRENRLGLIDIAWRLALPRADRVTAISTYLVRRAHEFGYKGEVALIPNGVDLENFKFAPHNFNKPETTLITTSRLSQKNAIEDVISALTLLPDNVKFKIIGTGELEFDLKRRVREARLNSRVEFCGFVSHDNIPKHLAEADIFIRPSLSEGMGNSFIEAMAAGLPVIATPVGGIPDFLKDGETGLFCEPHNPESIAHAVTRIVDDSHLRSTIITNAHRLATEKYDWNLIAKEMKSKVLRTL